MMHEEYRLTLTHYMVDEKGGKFPIDDPIVVRQIFQGSGTMYSMMLVNSMLDEMKRYVLGFLCKQGEQNA